MQFTLTGRNSFCRIDLIKHGGQEFSTTPNDWQDEQRNSACSHLGRMTCVGALEQHAAWPLLRLCSCLAVL